TPPFRLKFESPRAYHFSPSDPSPTDRAQDFGWRLRRRHSASSSSLLVPTILLLQILRPQIGLRISAGGSDAAISPQVRVSSCLPFFSFRSFAHRPGSGFRLAAQTPPFRLKFESPRAYHFFSFRSFAHSPGSGFRLAAQTPPFRLKFE